MFVKCAQDAAQVDDFRAIELQRRYSCASGRCDAKDFQVVGAQCEMLCPLMTARMKQRRQLSGQRVARFDLCMLVLVATLTSQRQIVFNGLATAFARRNVFDGEGMRRIVHLAQAILASVREHAQLPSGGGRRG